MIKVGIFLPNWIGDVVMATPTIRALRDHYGPAATLIGILRPYVAEVLAGTPWLSQSLIYERQAGNPERGGWSLIQQMREQRLDSVILLTNSLRSAIFGWASGAPQRVGYVRYGRGPLLTERLQPPREGLRLQPVSAVDYYLQLAQAVGAATPSRQLELATQPGDEQHADQLWDRNGWRPEQPIVVLSSGAAHGNAKRWPPEYFAELARRLTVESSVQVLIICGPADREIADSIQRMSRSDRVHSLANEKLSVGLSKAIVRRSQLLITNDSGPRHFAAAFRIPSIALFGPTDPRWSENYHPLEWHLRRDVPCGPCGRRQCPLVHHQCMRDLTVDYVCQTAQELLKRRSSRAAA